MEAQNLKTFKDFLHFYNTMSEMCFSQCVTSLHSRHLEKDEDTCVDQCASKYINCNNRIIKVYAEVQEKLVEKRMKELEADHAKQEAEAAAAAEVATATVETAEATAVSDEAVQVEQISQEIVPDTSPTEPSVTDINHIIK